MADDFILKLTLSASKVPDNNGSNLLRYPESLQIFTSNTDPPVENITTKSYESVIKSIQRTLTIDELQTKQIVLSLSTFFKENNMIFKNDITEYEIQIFIYEILDSFSSQTLSIKSTQTSCLYIILYHFIECYPNCTINCLFTWRSPTISDLDFPHFFSLVLSNSDSEKFCDLLINSNLSYLMDYRPLVTTSHKNLKIPQGYENWNAYLNQEEFLIDKEWAGFLLNWFLLEYIPNSNYFNSKEYETKTLTLNSNSTHPTFMQFSIDLVNVIEKIESKNKKIWPCIDNCTIYDLFPSICSPNSRRFTIVNSIFFLFEYTLQYNHSSAAKILHKLAMLIESNPLFKFLSQADLNPDTLSSFINMFERTESILGSSITSQNTKIITCILHFIGSLSYHTKICPIILNQSGLLSYIKESLAQSSLNLKINASLIFLILTQTSSLSPSTSKCLLSSFKRNSIVSGLIKYALNTNEKPQSDSFCSILFDQTIQCLYDLSILDHEFITLISSCRIKINGISMISVPYFISNTLESILIIKIIETPSILPNCIRIIRQFLSDPSFYESIISNQTIEILISILNKIPKESIYLFEDSSYLIQPILDLLILIDSKRIKESICHSIEWMNRGDKLLIYINGLYGLNLIDKKHHIEYVKCLEDYIHPLK